MMGSSPIHRSLTGAILAWPGMTLLFAAPARADDATAASEIGRHVVPHDLSPWGMFSNADPVVQTVMIGLALASVLTWTVWLAKTIELLGARRRAAKLVADLDRTASLAEAARLVQGRTDIETGLITAALAETRQSAGIEGPGLKERVATKLERMESAAGRRMAMGTGILATIGSIAPFVGLFGTVWGIMNSFVGISRSQTTNLAVVAPGIAEALLATALGLVAAIPAVVIYNIFARAIGGYKAMLGDASAEVLRLISRDLDRCCLPLRKAAE